MATYFFNEWQELIKIVPDTETVEAIQTQELPDAQTLLKDTLTVRVRNDEKLSDAEYMAVKSYEGNAQAFDMYRIITSTMQDDTTTYTGMSLGAYELEGAIIQDRRPNNVDMETFVNSILTATDWRLGYVDSGLPAVTGNFYYVSVKEALKTLQANYGVEFAFKVEISGRRLTDKWIEIYDELGDRTMKRFNYGTNALTVVRETSKSEIYTALIGRGKGEQVSTAEENAGGQAGYGRRITFENVTWSTDNGDPLDKPYGQNYLEYGDATAQFGMRTIDGAMLPRIGIVEFSEEEDPRALLEKTYQQLLVTSRPQVLFKTTVAQIGATGIGDTVTIHRHDLNIHYQTRVRKIVRDKLDDNRTEIELGDAVYTPSTKQQKQTNATIKNLFQDLQTSQENMGYVISTADGKNNAAYSEYAPEQKRTGDLWFRPHPEKNGETQMLRWDGNAWELRLDTSVVDEIATDYNDLLTRVSDVEDDMDTALANADQALQDSGANSTLLDTHKQNIKDIQDNAKTIQENVGTILNNYVTQKDIDESILQDNRIKDTRDDNRAPSWYISNYPRQTVTEFKRNSVLGVSGHGTYGVLTTEVPWNDSSGGQVKQTLETDAGTLRRRGSGSTWGAWERDLTQGTFDSWISSDYETTESYAKASYDAVTATGDNALIKSSDFEIGLDGIRGEISEVEGKIPSTDGLVTTTKFNQLEATVDGYKRTITETQTLAGNASTKADAIANEPEKYITNYQNILETKELYERVIGEDETDINSKVSRIVQNSDVIRLEVQKSLEGETRRENVYSVVGGTKEHIPVNAASKTFTLNEQLQPNSTYRLSMNIRVFADNANQTRATIYVGGRQLSSMTIYPTVNTYSPYISTGNISPTDKIEFRFSPKTSSDSPVSYAFDVEIVVSEMESIEVPVSSSENGAIRSEINQLYDLINLAIVGEDGGLSKLAVGAEGVTLKGDIIKLEGDTIVDGDFWASNVNSVQVNADNITAGELDASKANIINLNVSSIAGKEAEFTEAIFNGRNSRLKITGDMVSILDHDLMRAIEFDSDQINFYGDVAYSGKLSFANITDINTGQYIGRGLHLFASTYGHVTISKSDSNSPSSGGTISLGVRGDNGNVYIEKPIFANINSASTYNSAYGLRIVDDYINVSAGVRYNTVKIARSDNQSEIHFSENDIYFKYANGYVQSLKDMKERIEALERQI